MDLKLRDILAARGYYTVDDPYERDETPDTEATDRTEITQPADHAGHQHEYDGPPVEEGEQRDVGIENLGDQGDGIAKVEHGYVVQDRHTHDDAAVARRHDVAVSVPEWDPDHILVGRGTSIHEGTTAPLTAALALD